MQFQKINRRALLGGGLAAVAAGPLAAVTANFASAAIGEPPIDSRAKFIAFMREARGEDPVSLGQRYDFYQSLNDIKGQWDERNARAFLMTPRELFVPKASADRAYQVVVIDIGFGGFITDPWTIARMNSTLNVQPGEKVLEVGTGSGYQSAYLSNLTDKVWSIEIIRPLYERVGTLYEDMIKRGYSEYSAISRAHGDGYYGWADAGPFDKIIVTCGIDHVPPPLLQQLKPTGVMLIPVGPPGAQRVLKITKKVAADGNVAVQRLDIFGGLALAFMPFANLIDNKIVGTHYGN